MQHAENVVRRAAPHRQPADGGAEHRVDDLARRFVGVEHHHLGAVDHDVGHGELAQIEHAAHHVAVELFDDAGAMQEIDGAAQLLARRQDRLNLADLHADAAQDHPHQPLDRLEDRQHQRDRPRDRLGDDQRPAIGRVERGGLRQHLAQHEDQRRHHDGGVDHAGLAEQREQQAGGQRRGGDVGRVVGEQDRAEETLALRQQAADDGGVDIAVLLQPQHRGARGRGQRRLAAGIKRRDQEADHHRGDGQPIVNVHLSASFSLKNARTCAASTPCSTKAEPIPRTRMNVSIPRFTFLSCAIKSISASASGKPPGMSCGRVGRPTSAR